MAGEEVSLGSGPASRYPVRVKPRVVYFGTPAIAVPALRALAEVATVTAVVCQPDKPAGRDPLPQAPPTKQAAIELGIPVHQPVKVRTPDFAAWVREQRADAGVVLAYGRILTGEVLAIPARGCINLHASLLPRYRGAAPIQWAVVRGERETGISLMQMDEGVDTGPVFLDRRLAIGPEETGGELTARMAELAAEMIRTDLLEVLAGKHTATPQDPAQATLAPILSRDDGKIDWSWPAARIHDLARGMHPWPGAFTHSRGRLLKILETRPVDDAGLAGKPGEVLDAGKGKVWVACGEGVLSIVAGQIEGKKPTKALELLGGRAVVPGEALG